MIKAAFFDVDGTLLSHSTNSVPQSARDSLAALRKKGIKTYLCTGRHAIELALLPVADIPFDGYITLNGHLCLDENRQMQFGLPFPEDTTRALIRLFKEQQIPLVLVEESGRPVLLPAARHTCPIDICGAGDACTAGLVSALAAGASYPEAAFIGNLASGVTVRQIGRTGTATREAMLSLYDEQFGE